MELYKQCCSLEQAKRLKELGVDQNCSYLCFLENSAGKYMLDTIEGNFYSHCRDYEISVHPGGFEASFIEQVIAAFTVAELGVMLPDGRDIDPEYTQITTCRNYSDVSLYACFCEKVYGLGAPTIEEVGKTEAEARASMLIYLLENNLTTAEEVNQRLNS